MLAQVERTFRQVSSLPLGRHKCCNIPLYLHMWNFSRYRMSAPRDQWLVRKIRRAPERSKCRIKAWWPHPSDFLFPEPKHLRMRSFPQFMHITNTFRAQWIDSNLQQAFLEDALRLTDEEKMNPNSLALVPENFWRKPTVPCIQPKGTARPTAETRPALDGSVAIVGDMVSEYLFSFLLWAPTDCEIICELVASLFASRVVSTYFLLTFWLDQCIPYVKSHINRWPILLHLIFVRMEATALDRWRSFSSHTLSLPLPTLPRIERIPWVDGFKPVDNFVWF